MKGLVATKLKLLEWEMIFTRVLLDYNIPLLPVVASDFIITRNGRISSADLRPIQSWLRLGCIPSTGGDIVSDSNTRFSVLSGDQIASYLAIKFHASKLIFGVDVDGVYSSNPKLNRHAHILSELTLSEARNAVGHAKELDAPDVTGGMAGKLKEALTAVSNGVPVYLVNLTRGNRVVAAACNQKVLCSKILPPTASQ
jgi:isopentenyl phosphate kinase